jgi:uncharacterized protein YndB with AHSA1/START domain
VPSDAARLVVQAEFPRLAPAALFEHFTRPELLRLWWPESAEVDPQPGGRYHFAWPGPNWHLRGEFTEFAPPARLAFTWAWDHEPDLPARHVHLTIEPAGAGSRLTVVHTAYTASQADQADRVSHLEGWRHFLARLQAI